MQAQAALPEKRLRMEVNVQSRTGDLDVDQEDLDLDLEETSTDEEEEEYDDDFHNNDWLPTEEERMARYRENWDYMWSDRCGKYEYRTSVSSMVGTVPNSSISYSLCHPGSLQVYSIKVTKIREGLLTWPLEVYGMVAARDNSDHRRNVLFDRPRDKCQILTDADQSLLLTGPYRAIMGLDAVHFEIQLKVKGGTSQSQDDEALINQVLVYNGSVGLSGTLYNKLCVVKLNFRKISGAVQATFIGVRVAGGPSGCGLRVAAHTASRRRREDEVVLLDSETLTGLQDSEGFLGLTRRVVSVELDGRLIVDLEAYSPQPSGAIGSATFRPKMSGMSQGTCQLSSRVTNTSWGAVHITVAWSFIPVFLH